MRRWWLSSQKMTIEVATQGMTIVSAPPIVRKFIGQPSIRLVRWMADQGGLRIEELKDT